MSSNQCKVTPWRDWHEWGRVYALLVSGDKVKEVLVILNRWRMRGKLPISVEATFALLTVMGADEGEAAKKFHSDLLALAYSQAIVRFVNLLTDVAQKGATAVSMDRLGASLELPAWIVQVRHSATHGTHAPPLSVLRKAAKYILDEYCMERYWHAQRSLLTEQDVAEPKPRREPVAPPHCPAHSEAHALFATVASISI